MRWFGFGFNAFGQICAHDKLIKAECRDDVDKVKVISPTELASHVNKHDCCFKSKRQIGASWSRRASLHLDGKSVRERESSFNDSGRKTK